MTNEGDSKIDWETILWRISQLEEKALKWDEDLTQQQVTNTKLDRLTEEVVSLRRTFISLTLSILSAAVIFSFTMLQVFGR